MYKVASSNKIYAAISIEQARHLCVGKISATISKDHDVDSEVPDNFLEYWEFGKKVPFKKDVSVQEIISDRLKLFAASIENEEYQAIMVNKIGAIANFLLAVKILIEQGREEEAIQTLKDIS